MDINGTQSIILGFPVFETTAPKAQPVKPIQGGERHLELVEADPEFVAQWEAARTAREEARKAEVPAKRKWFRR